MDKNLGKVSISDPGDRKSIEYTRETATSGHDDKTASGHDDNHDIKTGNSHGNQSNNITESNDIKQGTESSPNSESVKSLSKTASNSTLTKTPSNSTLTHAQFRINAIKAEEAQRATSTHRRTSFFNTSTPPYSLPAEATKSLSSIHENITQDQLDEDAYIQGLSVALAEHISATQKQMSCSPYTLSFLDEIDEEFYREFTASIVLQSWMVKGIMGILLLMLIQLVMSFTLLPTPTVREFYFIPMVYIPMFAIVAFVYFSDDEFVCNHLQPISVLYILFAGPVFLIGRSWLIADQFNNYVLSPVYVTILFCSAYFLQIRYIYSLVIAFLSIVTWFALSTLSWIAIDHVNQGNSINMIRNLKIMQIIYGLEYLLYWQWQSSARQHIQLN